MSLVATYISLDLLPKVFTVLSSYPALFAVLGSTIVGFGLAGYITYSGRGAL
jgi:hypothetical protein